MRTSGFVKYAGAAFGLALCAACGGGSGSAVAPSTAALDRGYAGGLVTVNGRPVTAAHPNLRALPPYVPIALDNRSTSRTYEYIINDYGTYAGVFDYPASDRQIGTIDNVGGQGCTNVLYGYGKKTFWIVAGANQITEYRVPKKALRTLTVPSGEFPSSCAMDGSGDLAVGILAGSNEGDIVIFKNATGTGTAIPTPLAREYFDGYDNKGNLFFDGFTASYSFQLDEIPKGSSKVQTIATSNTVQFPGSVQWDGTYLAVTDQIANAIYQYTVTGTKATLQHTISFSVSSDCAQTWIVKGLVYCADAGNEDGEVFKYPGGGSPVAVFTGNFDLPLGTVAAER